MKKTVMASIAAMSLIAVGLIMLLVYLLMRGGNVMTLSDMMLTDTITINMEDIDHVKLEYRSDDIILYASDSKELSIKEYRNYKPKNKTEVINDSNTVNIIGSRWDHSFGSIFGRRSRIEVYLPTDYNGELKVATSSGDISSDASFHIFAFYANCSSGDISLNEIVADDITLDASSGDIDISKAVGQLKVEVTSGDINISEFRGSGSIRTSSGDMSLNLLALSGDLKFIASSGDMELRIPDTVNFKYEAEASSGDIRTYFDDKLEFSHNKKHAYGVIGDNAEYRIDMKVSSGDISVVR